MNELLIYIGAGIVTLWGVAHLSPTQAVVRGFGDISEDNRQLIRMEWLAEGFALIFIGVVAFLAAAAGEPGNPVATAVVWACAGVSAAIALLALFTGARTKIVPVKLCPAVMAVTSALFLAGILA